MRHHSLGRGKTVGELRTGEATDAIQKTLELTLRVVEPPSTGPTVRPPEDRGITKRFSYSVQLSCHQFIDFLPAHFNKGIRAAQVRPSSWPTCQPSFSHHRCIHPHGAVLYIQNAGTNWRWIAILFKGQQFLHPTITYPCAIGAPMRTGKGKFALVQHFLNLY